jgi:signal transduction histidine kinase/ActR/RegA family two-component response regulator
LFGSTTATSVDDLRSRVKALEALVARAPVPIAVAHDAECHYISANAALATLLGVPQGVNISMTPPPGEKPLYRIQREGRDIPADELPMQYAIAHRTGVSNDIEIMRADGTVLYVQNDVEPLYDAQGNVCGCVSVCVDLTERKHVEAVLREADRRKDEFLATLSHELRNPLAPIRNALEVLRRGGGDPKQTARAHAIMERQLHQLVRLTDDLLDVSRITRNRLELRRERIDLRSAVQSAIETTQPLIDAAAHVLKITAPTSPVWVHADFTRLAQAFANLLNNAVKYTERGGQISIGISSEGDLATLTVRDSGVGMSETTLPHIFDMFRQSDESLDRARGGLGIGLTLAKRLIELHGGTIHAHSEGPGRGSTFVMQLPLAVEAPARPATVERPRIEVPSRRVLIAEDIPDAAEMLRVMLDLMGHDVRVAADGVQAVAIAKEFNPDVALLDIGMPRMDGYQAAREIRAALGSRVLLIALTGWGQEEDQRRSREAGFDHHLTKPAEPDVLEELIASAATHSAP